MSVPFYFCHLSKTSIGGLVQDLSLIAEVATYDELRNQVVWVPLDKLSGAVW